MSGSRLDRSGRPLPRGESMIRGPTISVVVPVYNEMENLTLLVEEVRRALDPWAIWELILVDDGSTAKTRDARWNRPEKRPGRDPHYRRAAGASFRRGGDAAQSRFTARALKPPARAIERRRALPDS